MTDIRKKTRILAARRRGRAARCRRPRRRAAAEPSRPSGDRTTDAKRLYVVGYAHLDTQWRWTYPMVIGDYIPNTLRRQLQALFEKYPAATSSTSAARAATR